MPFLDWLDSAKAGSPRWLTHAAGGDWVRSVAIFLDACVETARQGVKLRFPSTAPPDALAAIAEERQEARATAVVYEADPAFAERLRTAWSRRAFNGTKTGLVAVVGAIGFGSFSVYDRLEWFPSKTWHAWVVVPFGAHPWGPGPVVGDGTVVGDGSTVGSSMRASEVRNLREVTASWVPPHTRTFLHLQLVDGVIVGDGSEVGDGSVVGGESCFLRLGKATLS